MEIDWNHISHKEQAIELCRMLFEFLHRKNPNLRLSREIKLGAKKPHGIDTYFFKFLFPYGGPYTEWRDLSDSAKEELKARWLETGGLVNCNYDFIGSLTNYAFKSNRKLKLPSDENGYLKIAWTLKIDTVKQLVEKVNERLGHKKPSEEAASIFSNTKWEVYFRSRRPKKSKICVVNGILEIKSSKEVTITNPEGPGFLSYKGEILQFKDRQFIIELKFHPSNKLGYTIMMFSLSDSQISKKLNDVILDGLYIQKNQEGISTRGGTILLRRTDNPREPGFIDFTISKEDNPNAFPILEEYSSFDDKIRRFFFVRDHNFISTSNLDLSDEDVFEGQLRKWDDKYSTKGRALIDVFISCPVESYSHLEENFYGMKEQVELLKEFFRKFLMLTGKPKDEPLVIRTPFDEDKKKEFKDHDDLIDPNVNGSEIENAKLFVMYYPNDMPLKNEERLKDIHIGPSSCLVEAAWAVRAGVSCLFLVNDETRLPRYLRKMFLPNKYPLHVCYSTPNKIKPTKLMNDDLGEYLTIKWRRKRPSKN